MQLAWRISTLVVAIAYTACHDEPASRGEDRILTVTQPGIIIDQVNIYVATPSGPGPFPVVVYGHGQGAGNAVNCGLVDSDVEQSKRMADALAREGYLAIAVFYRNRGDGAPRTGELRPRDHHIFDARAFLAAAQLGRELGGDARVALIGLSMGSFPATWAVASLPELSDLQAGLDIVTSIPTGMLGNHVANTGRNKNLLVSEDLSARATAITLATFTVVGAPAAVEGRPTIASDLGSPLLTPAGAELFRRSFIEPGCDGQRAAACDPACLAKTFDEIARARGFSEPDARDWLTAEAIEAIDYWTPPLAINPPSQNRLLAAQRALSPTYSLTGPLKTRRIFPLISEGDHVIRGQTAAGNGAATLYLARLRATGIALPDPPVVKHPACGHEDYFDPAMPHCGWSLVLAELAAAFE